MLEQVRGRTARPASVARHLTATLAQAAAFWSFFLGLLPAAVYAVEGAVGGARFRFATGAGLWAGVGLFAAAGSLGLWSAVSMARIGRGTPFPLACPARLVVAGPYRRIRNPMVLAGLLQGVGVGLALGSFAVIAYALAGGPFWNYLVRPWEEQDLERRFGAEYLAYRDRVRCWIPTFRLGKDEFTASGGGARGGVDDERSDG